MHTKHTIYLNAGPQLSVVRAHARLLCSYLLSLRMLSTLCGVKPTTTTTTRQKSAAASASSWWPLYVYSVDSETGTPCYMGSR